jgi:hypothetical protein
MFMSLPAARNWADNRPEYRIIRITTYAVTRPVVREVILREHPKHYEDLDGVPVTAYVRDGIQVLAVHTEGNEWDAWRHNAGKFGDFKTRAEAELACRKALRDMGYRVERAT